MARPLGAARGIAGSARRGAARGGSVALAVACALAGAGGCTRAPAHAVGDVVTSTADTIWYISARDDARGGESSRPATTLTYGLVTFAHPPGSIPPGGALPATPVDSVQLTEVAFAEALATRVAVAPAPDDYAVLYVHGFGTSRHEAWTHTVAARHRAGARTPWIVFCWPSRGSGMGAPRRGALLTSAYHDDSAAAQASIPSFVSAVDRLLGTLPPPRVVLVAHSLGGQLLGDALASDTALRARLRASPLRGVAFIAPDVEATRFADVITPAVRPLTQRLVLYASARDRVLRVSRQLHGSARAGLRGSIPLLRDGLETVDATRAWTSEGWIQRQVGTHHSVKRASGVLFDLGTVVGPGRAPQCRLALGTATLTALGEWRLGDRAPALDSLRSASCAPGAAPLPSAPRPAPPS